MQWVLWKKEELFGRKTREDQAQILAGERLRWYQGAVPARAGVLVGEALVLLILFFGGQRAALCCRSPDTQRLSPAGQTNGS